MKKILIIGHVWPEPSSTAAGTRMLQLIDFFRSEEFEVMFASAASKTDKSYPLSQLNVTEVEIKLNHHSFDVWIEDLSPDIVMYDRFMVEEQFSWRVTESCPTALQILNTEDLHFVRKGREEGYDLESQELLLTDTAKREIASIYRSDFSLIISEAEMEFLVASVGIPEAVLFYLPFMINEISDGAVAKLPDFEKRIDFITIGSFKHSPNVDSVRYLKSEIWPKIREALPQVKLHVYGSYANQNHLSMQSEKDGFFVNGFVKESDLAFQNARICLAPLRFGAGLKGKVFEALVNGTPCVMTPISAEGIFATDHSSRVIADDPVTFANYAVELYKNQSQWEECQLTGIEIINTKFAKFKHNNRFRDKLHTILSDIATHRKNNFMGE
ncbi:MAG: glycosyltransferase, partial [Flavobacteriaceae bacterium]|nr:glycosyltransferase [Flavobacteriaceae bacterium]